MLPSDVMTDTASHGHGSSIKNWKTYCPEDNVSEVTLDIETLHYKLPTESVPILFQRRGYDAATSS